GPNSRRNGSPPLGPVKPDRVIVACLWQCCSRERSHVRSTRGIMTAAVRRDGAARYDRTLSDDIYLLAGILGDVITSLAGDEAFALEEEVRSLAKDLRAGGPGASDELEAMIHGADTAELRILIRAFTNYFQLINLAEDNE